MPDDKVKCILQDLIRLDASLSKEARAYQEIYDTQLRAHADACAALQAEIEALKEAAELAPPCEASSELAAIASQAAAQEAAMRRRFEAEKDRWVKAVVDAWKDA